MVPVVEAKYVGARITPSARNYFGRVRSRQSEANELLLSFLLVLVFYGGTLFRVTSHENV